MATKAEMQVSLDELRERVGSLNGELLKEQEVNESKEKVIGVLTKEQKDLRTQLENAKAKYGGIIDSLKQSRSVLEAELAKSKSINAQLAHDIEVLRNNDYVLRLEKENAELRHDIKETKHLARVGFQNIRVQ
jgi:chromosome segregation ATPase